MRITRDLMKSVTEGDIQHIQIAAVDYLQKFVQTQLDDKGQVIFTQKSDSLSFRFTPMVFIKRGVVKFEPCGDGSYIVALECSYGISGVIGLIVTAGILGAILAASPKPYYAPLTIVIWAILLLNQICIPGAYLKSAIKKRILKKKNK